VSEHGAEKDAREFEHHGVNMGHDNPYSMADAADSPTGRVLTNAVEQLAFEMRTANLIAYCAAIPERWSERIENEIATRLGIHARDIPPGSTQGGDS